MVKAPMRWLGIVLLVCAVLSIGLQAFDRPGGGQGYSGSSSSSSSSGDRDSGDGGGAALVLVFELLRFGFIMTSRYPAVMWPIWGVVALVVVLWFRSLPPPEARNWTVESMKAEPERVAVAPRVELERLRDTDPEFSLVLFEDFVSTLFAKSHEARGRGRLADLGAYLGPAAVRGLTDMSPLGLDAVEGIVIGAIGYQRVRGVTAPAEATSRIAVELEIEANYTEQIETNGARQSHAYWVRERWVLSRARNAQSLPPARLRNLGCPGCGAPVTSRDEAVCTRCGRQITPNDFDWIAERIGVIARKPTPPALTGDVAETGTTLPTIVDAAAAERRQAIEARDPSFTWPAFEARIRHVFAQLQPAWSSLDITPARAYLSDRLAETWQFWFAAYRRAGLRNVTESSRLIGIELARVVSDRHFDAITVRLRATGLDYTIDEKGELGTGSRDTPREYTEYWTLIRAQSATGVPHAASSCPQCGAPLVVSMGGACEHCGAHVSSGEFDWVLSRVEQDDAYKG